ncbi:hypothetical protein NM208_g11153 [Fusarium decemcellulare]|uniref:Uncharacterized protein n=1 Tax=Fusarium decemcellulare TaxID=57161 RepID=A0ACC1RVB3_9HYPO|nr:hypothetical protein NM208_g11153 [Fusarium decemcellulare]
MTPPLQAQSSQPAHQTPPTATQHYYYPPPPPHAPQGGHLGAPGAPGTASTAAMAMGFQSYNPQVPPQPTYASPSTTQPEGTYNSYANYQPAPPQDPLAALSSQMSGLNMQEGYRDAAAPSGPAPVADDSPRGPPPYQAAGKPWDTLAFCPEDRIVEHSLDWYRLPDIPEYLICTRCHADHIARTHLAGSFERVTRPDGFASICGFWYPRAKEVLWPQAVRSNDLSALRVYMKKDTTLPACKGRAVITSADGIKWYGMAQNEIDGFIACETCYEDRIAGTSFESRFSPYRQQGPDDKWTCDLGMPYISAAVAKMGKTNDWQGFVDGAKKRLSLRACEGEVVEYNGTNWYRPRRTIENMCICETCYLDKLALTRFANEFELEEQGTGFDAFMARIGKRVTCDLSDKAISMTSALDAAIHQRNFDVWWNAANSIINLVPCTENGIIRGKWWTVAGGCPELDICEACYSGIVKPFGVSHFFEQAERDSTATIVCNFHPKSPRFVSFVNKFNETLDKGVFSIYSDYVKKWAGVPVCPGIGHLEKAKWWGYPEALFCKSCYLGFVVDTPLADHIPVKEVYDERALVCQIWSPRMRKMWLEVCAAGPPGSPESEAALAEFKAFGTRRMEVYLATVPQIKMIQQMKMMKMQNAMHQGQLSLMYQGMNSMAAISGTTDGYLHGNSSLGYYETEHGATAAQMMNNMHSGMADANSGGDWMQIERLSAMWMEVE